MTRATLRQRWATCGECGGAGNQRWDEHGHGIPCFPCGGTGEVLIVSGADDLAGSDTIADWVSEDVAGAGGAS